MKGPARRVAHRVNNVSFAANNVNRPGAANRSETAWRRTKNACCSPDLGDRISCLGDRNSCRPNSGARIACLSAAKSRRFSGSEGWKFRRFNECTATYSSLRHISSKSNAPYCRYFRPPRWTVDFVGILEVNKRKRVNCTPRKKTPAHAVRGTRDKRDKKVESACVKPVFLS